MTRHGRSVDERLGLKYGAGGKAMRTLIEEILADGFAGAPGEGAVGLAELDDGAVIPLGGANLVITTDSHVIQPAFFPGGDIGRLAVSGTVNDLAMMGATEPLALTLAAIFEEGYEREGIERIWGSIRATCEEAGTTVVTGDTKLMGHGELDGVVLNTTGVGIAERVVGNGGLRPGDEILVTGTLGDHGLAVLATRNELAIETEIRSDVAPLNALVRLALDAGGEGVVAMKDPTRGGLASALSELAERSGVGVRLDEPSVPIRDEVRAAAELLGIDPLLVANEGKAVIAVRPERADAVLGAVREHPLGREAAIVATCVEDERHRVVVDTGFGRRLLVEPEADPMPRIC